EGVELASESVGTPSVGTRRIAMSTRGSYRIGSARSSTLPPPASTVVSPSPATTCALVTISPGAAAHPEPSIARPHAVPSTRTTLREAALTPGSRVEPGEGGATSGEGPVIDGSGSSRASASRIGPDGGRIELSSRRIAERWMSARSCWAPGVCAATAAAIHTTPSARPAPSAAPSIPSAIPRPGRTSVRRNRKAMPSSPVARIAPPSSAPSRPNAGAYGEAAPLGSSSGAMRVPRKAPSTKPANDRAPTMNPCRKPRMARTAANATISQSSPVTKRCSTSSLSDSRHQRLRRARPVLALAAVAFITGAIVGAHRGSSPDIGLAESYARSWVHRDYAQMYGEISPAAKQQTSPGAFAAAHREALRTATVTGTAIAGKARSHGAGRVTVPVRVHTRLWGTLTLLLTLEIVSIEGSPKVEWSRSQAFPGVPEGATLTRHTTLPRRAT